MEEMVAKKVVQIKYNIILYKITWKFHNGLAARNGRLTS